MTLWRYGVGVPLLLALLLCPAQGFSQTSKETPLGLLGLSKPDITGLELTAFFVGSFSYNSHIQMVPEFAGGAATLADPGATNFRFDKFGLGISKTFAGFRPAPPLR